MIYAAFCLLVSRQRAPARRAARDMLRASDADILSDAACCAAARYARATRCRATRCCFTRCYAHSAVAGVARITLPPPIIAMITFMPRYDMLRARRRCALFAMSAQVPMKAGERRLMFRFAPRHNIDLATIDCYADCRRLRRCHQVDKGYYAAVAFFFSAAFSFIAALYR